MMEYPEMDRYASLDSPMHRFDPRAKLIAFTFLIFSIVLLNELKLVLIGFFVSILFLIASKLPFHFVIQHLKGVSLFIIPFLVIMPFTVKGDEILSFYTIKMTYEGLRYGILVVLKAFSAVILIFPMVATTKFETTIKALDKLKVPNILVQMLMFTYRYIFVFVNEFQRSLIAMESRGFKLGTSLYALRTIGNALGMLFVRSYERAERVYWAMRSRRYTGGQKTLVEFKMCTTDYVLTVVIIAFAVCLHVVCYAGVGMV